MSPIRHDKDFQRTEIEDWDSWIQEEIEKARQRGEFDNLPGAGKPIEIYRTELNPEYDLAFSRLKNAGVMPAWMELDAEVRRRSEELDAFLERSVAYVAEQREQLVQRLARRGEEPTALAPRYPWWQVWRALLDWFRVPPGNDEERVRGPRTIGDLIRLRDHMREQYLERAAALDKTIAEYHNALPQALSHLQRLRMLPDRAARRFDEHLPLHLILDIPDPRRTS